MNAWRMALRGGYRGYDLWPICRRQKIAVLTYKGIYNTNLGPYEPNQKPAGWKLKGSAPSSMISFAWRIRGGDLIFVRDSMSDNEMIACGTVKGPIGKRAYKFDQRSNIVDNRGIVWRHKIDVEWHKNFNSFKYHDRAPNKSVLALNQDEIEVFVQGLIPQSSGNQIGTAAHNEEQAEQYEDSYMRSTPAMRKVIVPRHKALANRFVRYLKQSHSIRARWERDRIDISFEYNGVRVLAELKIAYGGNTRHAIREALGQILEYNHYGKYARQQPFTHWLLVLDNQPNSKDIKYIDVLRGHRKLPIFVGWPTDTGSSFDFSPSWPI